MRVEQLIEQLQEMPQQAEVQFHINNVAYVIDGLRSGDDGEPETDEESELEPSYIVLKSSLSR